MKLLNIDANAKTVKGQKKGYMTAVLYLLPYTSSGLTNLCPFAKEAGCWETCLNTAGRGGIGKREFAPGGIALPDNTIQRARYNRTELWVKDRTAFFQQLYKEISAFRKKADRKGLIPVVRLNGTSDIQWERERDWGGMTVFERFPDLQFYDYTKIPKRLGTLLPSNYYLCLSYSAKSGKYARACWELARQADDPASLVLVAKDEETKRRLMRFYEYNLGYPVVDGDEHDLRFTDPEGAFVFLKAKGSAKKETNGFVLGIREVIHDEHLRSRPLA